MTNDRLGVEEFPLTREFLSNMLGVRREGVSKAAGALQAANLIRYSRGMITLLNRRLEQNLANVTRSLKRKRMHT